MSKIINSEEINPSDCKPSDLGSSTPLGGHTKKRESVSHQTVNACDPDQMMEKIAPYICSMIDSTAPEISKFAKDIESLPDQFLLFSVADKLQMLSKLTHITVKTAINASIVASGNEDSISCKDRAEKVDTMFADIEKVITKIRSISITMTHPVVLPNNNNSHPAVPPHN